MNSIDDWELQLNKIVDDIRKREDKEMAYMLISELSPLFVADGVRVKMTKYDLSEEITPITDREKPVNMREIVCKYGISIDGLDFEKHDKRFETEIRQLKSEIEKLQSELSKSQENKATELPKINLNDWIKVKLTPHGANIYYHQFDELNKRQGRIIIEPNMPAIDKDGYTSFQLHDFISIYGKHIVMGGANVIEPLEIVYCGE